MKYSEFERLIISDIITQYPNYSSYLIEQFASLRVIKREIYATGFVTRFFVENRNAQIIGAPNMTLGENQWEINDLKYGSDYILWIKNGFIVSLEGFSYEEPWPSEIVYAKIIDKNISDSDY